jgi:protein O-GlcNAc transferase
MKAKTKSKHPISQESLSKAMALHQNGKIEAAEEIYKEILKNNPNSFDALHLFWFLSSTNAQM